MKLAIIAPMLNEAPVVKELYRRIFRAIVENIDAHCRIIFVDDGSKDGTPDVINSLKQIDNLRISVISHQSNYGLETAIISGLRETRNEAVIVLDSDLQDPPEMIPQIYNELAFGGSDLVVCKRKSRIADSLAKKFTAWLFYRAMKLISFERRIDLDSGNFRGLKPELVKRILEQNTRRIPFRYISSILSRKKYLLEYHREPRFAGRTKYSFNRLLNEAFESLLAINDNLIIFGSIQFCSSAILVYWLLLIRESIESPSGIFVFSLIIVFLNLLISMFILRKAYKIHRVKKHHSSS